MLVFPTLTGLLMNALLNMVVLNRIDSIQVEIIYTFDMPSDPFFLFKHVYTHINRYC